jgi:hypothetical protein
MLAGQAVAEAAESANASTRLLLGKDAYEQALRKLEAMRSEFEAWKETTCGLCRVGGERVIDRSLVNAASTDRCSSAVRRHSTCSCRRMSNYTLQNIDRYATAGGLHVQRF